MCDTKRVRTNGLLEHANKTMRVICIATHLANFTHNKVYQAAAHSKYIHGGNYTNFRIEDDDEDYYMIRESDLGRLFLLLPPE